jgi:hypothetical protein
MVAFRDNGSASLAVLPGCLRANRKRARQNARRDEYAGAFQGSKEGNEKTLRAKVLGGSQKIFLGNSTAL